MKEKLSDCLERNGWGGMLGRLIVETYKWKGLEGVQQKFSSHIIQLVKDWQESVEEEFKTLTDSLDGLKNGLNEIFVTRIELTAAHDEKVKWLEKDLTQTRDTIHNMNVECQAQEHKVDRLKCAMNQADQYLDASSCAAASAILRRALNKEYEIIDRKRKINTD